MCWRRLALLQRETVYIWPWQENLHHEKQQILLLPPSLPSLLSFLLSLLLCLSLSLEPVLIIYHPGPGGQHIPPPPTGQASPGSKPAPPSSKPGPSGTPAAHRATQRKAATSVLPLACFLLSSYKDEKPGRSPSPTHTYTLDICLKHVWSQSVPGGDNILTESPLVLLGTISNKGRWFLRFNAGGHSSKPKPRRIVHTAWGNCRADQPVRSAGRAVRKSGSTSMELA